MKHGIIMLTAAIIFFSCKNEDKDKSTTIDTLQTTVDTMQNKMPDSPGMMDTMPVPMVNTARASITGTYPDTTVTGNVSFEADSVSGKVRMKLDITVPAKAGKSVAVHIHEHGDCGNKAEMAHGHWNPTKEQHGKWGSGSYHSGDIGNVKLDKAGKGTMTLTTDRWTLGGTNAKNILRRAIIVHGGTDDYKTQPTGNAGTRIGCGVIQ